MTVILRIARIRGWVGWVEGAGGKPDTGYTFKLDCLEQLCMSPRSASHRPRQDWRALRDASPTQGWISDPYLLSSALHGSHCLSHDFIWSAKPALEKQTSQLSPLLQQCTGSVWVWLLAGPITSNWPNITLWSVFQYPVTNVSINLWFTKHFISVVICNKLSIS